MPGHPKDLGEIIDAAEWLPFDETIKKYNELADKNDPDAVPVLVMRMEDFLDDEPDEEPSDGDLSDDEL
jgi:hypothetical protein